MKKLYNLSKDESGSEGGFDGIIEDLGFRRGWFWGLGIQAHGANLDANEESKRVKT